MISKAVVLFLSLNFILPAQSNSDELEVIGAVMWYSKECKNTLPNVARDISKKLAQYGISEDPEFNDDVSNGMNMAWLAGCGRIKEKALEMGYSKYLICKKRDIVSEDGFLVSGCSK